MKSKRLQMALTLLLVFSFMLLFSSALAQTEVGQMAIVTTQTQGLNVRSWPGMDAPVTGCLSMGAQPCTHQQFIYAVANVS